MGIEETVDNCSVKLIKVNPQYGLMRLVIVLSHKLYGELYRFLEEHGCTYYGRDKATIALIIEYGLASVSEEKLTRTNTKMKNQMSEYAAARFKAYEYYMSNNTLTAGLRYLLTKNAGLKQKLKEKGKSHLVQENEWDNWDEATINGFYRRYIK